MSIRVCYLHNVRFSRSSPEEKPTEQRIVGALYTINPPQTPTVVAGLTRIAVPAPLPKGYRHKRQLAASGRAVTITVLSLLLSNMTTNADLMNGNFN
ncbi:hypothetical protein [Erwinia sp. SLM-02]|uniref:hypothetical protein n=1 Tax=Erwinia sp. SLM-02 TaxID=3020057 RepID=UPI00308108F0